MAHQARDGREDHDTGAAGPLAAGMLAVKDAVDFSRLSRAELYNAMGRGELRYYQYGRRRLIAKKDLIAWLDAKLTASNGK